MKQIRRKIFETNSSSSHSLTISNKGELEDFNLPLNENGEVLMTFGEFGWGEDSCVNQYEKLQYLLTMVKETELEKLDVNKNSNPYELFYNLDGFKAINKVIKQYCNGVIIAENELSIKPYNEGHYISSEGYIDHESCEDYSSLEDFLSYIGIGIKEFIFNSKYEMKISNDNC